MLITKFEDIISWQKSKELTLLIYRLLKNNKDFGFKDQIFRSSVSIMNNIAEGFEKNDSKEFRRYLLIAKGSCGETRSMLYIATELKYIPETDFNYSLDLSHSISNSIGALISKIH